MSSTIHSGASWCHFSMHVLWPVSLLYGTLELPIVTDLNGMVLKSTGNCELLHIMIR